MAQPAKVQGPSMEEILASIRRIIADDEAKPPAAEKPASPAAAPAKPEKPTAAAPAAKARVMNDIPPSAIPAAQAAGKGTPPVKAAPPPVAPPSAAPAPAPVVSNSQDDIDALLSGLDEATSAAEIRPPLLDGDVFDFNDEVGRPDPPQASFHKIEPEDDLEFAETAAARAVHRQPAFEPPPLETPPGPPPPPIF